MLFELIKSFVLIVLGFVLYHFIKNNLLKKNKKPIKNLKKTKEVLTEFEKKKVQLTQKEKRKMEKELTEYFLSIQKGVIS